MIGSSVDEETDLSPISLSVRAGRAQAGRAQGAGEVVCPWASVTVFRVCFVARVACGVCGSKRLSRPVPSTAATTTADRKVL